MSDVFTAFVEAVPDKLALMVGPPVPETYRFDIWRARHEGEVEYVHALAQCRGLIQAWTETGVTADVNANAVLRTTRQLRADYGTAKKATDPFWSDTDRYERQCRSEYGYLVHWHSTDVEVLARNGLLGQFVPLPRWCREWEVPSGCWDELPPVLAYVRSTV